MTAFSYTATAAAATKADQACQEAAAAVLIALDDSGDTDSTTAYYTAACRASQAAIALEAAAAAARSSSIALHTIAYAVDAQHWTTRAATPGLDQPAVEAARQLACRYAQKSISGCWEGEEALAAAQALRNRPEAGRPDCAGYIEAACAASTAAARAAATASVEAGAGLDI